MKVSVGNFGAYILKATEAYLENLQDIPFEEQCENYKVAYGKVIKNANPKITKIANTNMDKAIRKSKDMEADGKYDMSMFLDPEKPKKKFYYYETEKYLDEEKTTVIEDIAWVSSGRNSALLPLLVGAAACDDASVGWVG